MKHIWIITILIFLATISCKKDEVLINDYEIWYSANNKLYKYETDTKISIELAENGIFKNEHCFSNDLNYVYYSDVDSTAIYKKSLETGEISIIVDTSMVTDSIDLRGKIIRYQDVSPDERYIVFIDNEYGHGYFYDIENKKLNELSFAPRWFHPVEDKIVYFDQHHKSSPGSNLYGISFDGKEIHLYGGETFDPGFARLTVKGILAGPNDRFEGIYCNLNTGLYKDLGNFPDPIWQYVKAYPTNKENELLILHGNRITELALYDVFSKSAFNLFKAKDFSWTENIILSDDSNYVVYVKYNFETYHDEGIVIRNLNNSEVVEIMEDNFKDVKLLKVSKKENNLSE